MHYTTVVFTGTDPASPVVALGSEDPDEIDRLPLITSLHVFESVAVPLVHGSVREDLAMPVSDHWLAAVRAFGHCAKIGLILEPVAADIETSYSPVAEGVTGPDLPGWSSKLFSGELHVAIREVPVTSGGPLQIGMVPGFVGNVEAWADGVITPRR